MLIRYLCINFISIKVIWLILID